MAFLTVRQNPMATHGDRKILKSACFSQMDNALVQSVFGEYVKLTEAYPETKAYAHIPFLVPIPVAHTLTDLLACSSCTATLN